MAVPGAAKNSGVLGEFSAKPARVRTIVRDLPFPVRDGLLDMFRDVDALRAEPVAMRRRNADEPAQETSPRQCLERADFVRELARIVSFVERYAVPASVIYMRLDRLDEIAARHGNEAAAAAVRKVSETLTAQVRDTDFVGRLSDAGFGIILAKATEAEGAAKAEMLSGLVKASPVVWNGRAIPLSVEIGVQPLSSHV